MIKEAKVENGIVRGLSAADPRIISYKGIPFAAPPVGKLRWRAPQPAADWEGVRECYTFAPIAMQAVPGSQHNIYEKEWNPDPDIPMSEDCLYLNIWTPAKTKEERLPVYVWYFGGGLQEGNPAEMEFNGEWLARRGVVVVTINYRVNCFGFLCHPEITAEDPEFPANFGNLDQRAATLWVKRNIAAFGGDPDNITIGGQSAGGGSVITQLTSPLTEGMFRRAIIMSGSFGKSYTPFAKGRFLDLKAAEEVGRDFFKFIGAETLEEARALDAFYIRDKYLEWIGGKFDTTQLAKSKPTMGTVVDGHYVVGNGMQMMLENKRHMVPVLIGNTPIEFISSPAAAQSKEELEELVKSVVGDKAEEFLTYCQADSLEKMKELATYNPIELGARCILEKTAEAAKDMNCYYYQFDVDIPGDDHPGPFHSSDLWFVFASLAVCWRPMTGKHYDLARVMCNYWANFIKCGDPNGLDVDGSPMPEWLPYVKSRSPMYFGDKAEMKGLEKLSPQMELLIRDVLGR